MTEQVPNIAKDMSSSVAAASVTQKTYGMAGPHASPSPEEIAGVAGKMQTSPAAIGVGNMK